MARPKKPAMELRSIEDCTRAMGELLLATVGVQAIADEQALAVAGAQAKFEIRLDTARENKAALEAALQAYYYAHLAEMEDGGKRKSCKLANGVMGRRFGPGKLAPLNRSWTWKKIADAVRALFGMKYFRAVELELDKQEIKDKLDAEQMAKVGLMVKNTETFFAEPSRPEEPSQLGDV